MSLSNQENKEGLYDTNENKMSIVDFYNDVFLEEVEEITHKFP